MSDHLKTEAQAVAQWLATLEAWYAEVASNSHYQERVYCYFETGANAGQMDFAVALSPTPADVAAQPAEPAAATPPPETRENRSKPTRAASLVNNRPAVANLLPSRAAARGRVVVRRPARTDLNAPTSPESHKSIAPTPARVTRETQHPGLNDFKSADSYNSFNIDNNLAGYSFKIASSSALNEDLLKLLILSAPPKETNDCVSLVASLSRDILSSDPCFCTEGARYGILLRAALIAKITGSKANLALYINRLEDLRALFGQVGVLPLSTTQRAYLTRALWRLLDEVREAAPVIPAEMQNLPGELRRRLSEGNRSPARDLGDLLWYRWNFTLPVWISKHIAALTRCGHTLAFGAFAALLLLSLHPGLDFTPGMLAPWLAGLTHWRTHFLPDGATLAIALASAAGAVYAFSTRRMTLPERVALSINDKIETVLDSKLADLMKANMDVQIGRLGRGEPPALTPESVARKLDAAFAMKDMVNSYESTVRARRRHVAAEVSKAQHIRLESHQRLRNAALGVTASFVLLEIGGRIQDHRDLQAGTDAFSYLYWLERGKLDANAPTATPETPITTLDCARTEVVQQQPPSSDCLNQWRDSALASSSQLLFLVFLIAMLMFAVRVIRPVEKPDTL
ncbi:hypothetical protein [Bordetella sp. 02P26C-1]|uniref:hypothetical protein n=1 Tax=Bordetella sp. 02P26C-1 TaxID=2683195 RepID=UPI00135217AE|nr:hypothetical protein [Bordetella sp. 02P26C-1]MVW79106.1 hypothetical protein [Bordetella sp. 02P26C-1]